MSRYEAVSRQRFGDRCWRRYSDYRFAAGDALAPLAVQELPKAAMCMPIGFVASAEGFVPVALQGLRPGRNLLVDADGRWRAGYVPAIYRGYPFALMNADNGQQVLCVDVDSELVVEAGAGGEPFFAEAGAPASGVADVMAFLTQLQGGRALTARMCAALQAQELIQPWPLKIRAQAGEQDVAGVFRVDEARLSGLSPEAFESVRQAGALPMVYCQLLSMQHVSRLAELAQQDDAAERPTAAALPTTPDGELDLEFMKGDTFRFGGL